MSKDLHQIDEIFKNGLEGKEDNPSPQVWHNIENELDQKKSKRPFLYFPNSRKIAAILLVSLGSVALFAGGYFLRGVHMSNSENRTNPPIEHRIPASGNEKSAPADTEQKVSEENISRTETTPALSSSAPSATGESGANTSDLASTGGSAASKTSEGAHAPASASAGSGTAENKTSKRSADKSAGINTSSEFLAGVTDKKKAHTSGTITGDLSHNATNKIAANKTVNKKQAGDSESVKIKSDTKENNGAATTTVLASNNSKKTEARTSTSNSDAIKPEGRANDMATNPHAMERADITHEMQLAKDAAEQHPLPETEKQLVASSDAFKQNELATAPAAAIPVMNKKQGSLNLPRFSLTPVAALQLGSNRIKETPGHNNSAHVKQDIVRTESQPSSLAGGLLADLKISRNMTLQSGIVFTSRTIEIDPKNIIAEKNPDGKVRYRFECSAGTYFIKKAQGYTRPGDTTMTKFSTNELNYINIPLGLTYHFGGSKWHLFLSGGTGLNLLTKQYLETGLKSGYYDEQDTKVSNLKSSYLNGSIGAGLQWSPFRKISFTLNPQYQFALTPMNENMPIKAFPRIFNIQTGVQIRL